MMYVDAVSFVKPLQCRRRCFGATANANGGEKSGESIRVVCKKCPAGTEGGTDATRTPLEWSLACRLKECRLPNSSELGMGIAEETHLSRSLKLCAFFTLLLANRSPVNSTFPPASKKTLFSCPTSEGAVVLTVEA